LTTPHRIISFFVLGALMIAASYAYHRVEKMLAEFEPQDQ